MTSPALLQGGEIVIADVLNAIEDPNTGSRRRPVILVSRTTSGWTVMGVTTKDRHDDGTPRQPIPGWRQIGLHSVSYLWGARLSEVSVIDVHEHVGWANPELVEVIIELVGLDGERAEAFKRSALSHP